MKLNNNKINPNYLFTFMIYLINYLIATGEPGALLATIELGGGWGAHVVVCCAGGVTGGGGHFFFRFFLVKVTFLKKVKVWYTRPGNFLGKNDEKRKNFLAPSAPFFPPYHRPSSSEKK